MQHNFKSDFLQSTRNAPGLDRVSRAPIWIGLLLAGFIAGCTDSTPPPLIDPNSPRITGAPELKSLKGKGGTNIVVLVNKTPITSNHIQRRAAFVRLRRMKGNSNRIAKAELIDEAIKMREARRIGAVVGSSEVNAAYARFAKDNKMPVSSLNRMMAKSGVTERGFKDFIKASMSWQRAVAARLRSSPGGAGRPAGPSWLPAVGANSAQENEYTIQQIVFIVPQRKRKTLLAKRRAEAKRYRGNLRGCTNTRELAAGLTDVSVLDRGRLLESQLPPRWAKEIKGTPVGKPTRVRDDVKGVEMIVVCKTRQVIGQSTGIDSSLLSGGGKAASSKLEKEYLKEITDRAVIVER